MVLQFSFQHVDQVNFSCKRTQTQLQNHFSTTPCPSHETLKGMFKKENVNASVQGFIFKPIILLTTTLILRCLVCTTIL